jgi:L-ribulose-5-phosphate 3-epimerase
MTMSRRHFLLGAAAAAGSGAGLRAHGRQQKTPRLASPFRVGVLTDEIGSDLGRVAEIAATEFGMGWVELREVWKKNVTRLDAAEIAEARRILAKYDLRVTAIASPLFKVDWPGAPRSKFSPIGDQFKADWTFDQQAEVLDRCIELAKTFGTDRIRCFDFWRLADVGPYRAAMNDKLREAAAKAGAAKVVLVLENEPACNTATAAESAATLAAVRSDAFKLNWDAANSAATGDKAFPDGYALLPKDRISHVHVKDVIHKADGTHVWAAMGQGSMDWTGQFRALLRDGYRGSVVLETHWRGAGTPEASTRQCWSAMSRQLREAGAL